MHQQLERLVSLQGIDMEIQGLSEAIEAIPEALVVARQGYDQVKREVEGLQEKLSRLAKERRAGEREVEQGREQLKKTKVKLHGIKSNKEYAAVLVEIDVLEKRIDQLEEQILECMEATEGQTVELASKERLLQDEERRYEMESNKCEEELVQLRGLLEAKRMARQQITEGVEVEWLQVYSRILANRKGLAVVPVVGSACQGCYMSIPPQTVQEIKTNSCIITCSHCSRILYWAGPPIGNTASGDTGVKLS